MSSQLGIVRDKENKSIWTVVCIHTLWGHINQCFYFSSPPRQSFLFVRNVAVHADLWEDEQRDLSISHALIEVIRPPGDLELMRTASSVNLYLGLVPGLGTCPFCFRSYQDRSCFCIQLFLVENPSNIPHPACPHRGQRIHFIILHILLGVCLLHLIFLLIHLFIYLFNHLAPSLVNSPLSCNHHLHDICFVSSMVLEWTLSIL